jgi:salicylate hydroxylase/6-hydroxynicotinate 3-monooxygenase
MAERLNVAIIGAGMGGLTAAATLPRAGIDVNVYEQASAFTRIGSGIQMSPNAMKVLRAIGLEQKTRDIAFRPDHQLSRNWDTGHVNLDYPFGDVVEERYGAPYLLMHRGDLHALLASLVPAERIHRGKKLVDLDQSGDGVRLHFEDGSTAHADAVIAADGVHSLVRAKLFGADKPTYSGRVAYRTTFPASRLREQIDDCTKWWGVDRHIVIYYTTKAKDEVYFVTSVPEPAWTQESWSLQASVDELRAAFVGFHPTVTQVLEACPEDAALLARCLEGCSPGKAHDAFLQFEGLRKERTAQIQQVSHQNTWLHRSGNTDWVFGYDVWKVPLDEGKVAAAQ